MSDEPTECHPYDDACGGPGGRCRNHGGIGDLNAALAAAEQKVAAVEALAEKFDSGTYAGHQFYGFVLAHDLRAALRGDA